MVQEIFLLVMTGITYSGIGEAASVQLQQSEFFGVH